jgi:ABC-type Mn2+/Zn2+ transport system ATPase subunit
VLGLDPTEDAAELKGRIGFLVKDLETMGSLTSRDVLDICAAVRGCSTAYAKDLAERLDLELDRPMGDLCRGQLRRLGIVQALMHKPDVIVLDDPTTELDDTARQALPALLHEAAARGAAVLLTAQSPTDAEAYADRIVFLDSSPVPVSAPAVEDAETSPAVSCDAAAAGDWPQQIPTGYDPLRESELVPISVRRIVPAMSPRGRTPGGSSSSQGTGSADRAEPMGRVPP